LRTEAGGANRPSRDIPRSCEPIKKYAAPPPTRRTRPAKVAVEMKSTLFMTHHLAVYGGQIKLVIWGFYET
jgi:hypothetical protein